MAIDSYKSNANVKLETKMWYHRQPKYPQYVEHEQQQKEKKQHEEEAKKKQ